MQPPERLNPTASPVLAIVSLLLGIVGLAGLLPTLIFTFCAVLPLGFGIAALIVGFLAKGRVKKDPMKYSGGGFAIAGIVTGTLSVLAPILLIALIVLIYAGLAGANMLSK